MWRTMRGLEKFALCYLILKQVIFYLLFELLFPHTIRKVKFLSKNSILTKPQHFQEFFTQIFFDNFSREIKVVNSHMLHFVQKIQN